MGNLLVVDDNESICQLVTDFFQDLKGHTVYSATGAEAALALARERKPDVVLLDIMMPGTHGIEVLRQLRKLHPDLKVIMITAVDDQDIAAQAMSEGAVDYVTKPLDLNYLDAQVTFQLLE